MRPPAIIFLARSLTSTSAQLVQRGQPAGLGPWIVQPSPQEQDMSQLPSIPTVSMNQGQIESPWIVNTEVDTQRQESSNLPSVPAVTMESSDSSEADSYPKRGIYPGTGIKNQVGAYEALLKELEDDQSSEQLEYDVSSYTASDHEATPGVRAAPTPQSRRFITIADNLTARLKFLDPTGKFTGNTGWQYTEVLSKVQKYGCYCFPDERFGPGNRNLLGNRGTPVDSFDRLCLHLYRCHRCIYDFDHSSENCENESKYRSFFNDAIGAVECSPANSPCQMAQCECDRDFVVKVADLWTNQDDSRNANFVYNRYYWKDFNNQKKGPTFGYRAECVSKGDKSNTADGCCGPPGSKRPYNSMIASCCMDSIEPFGTC